MGRPDGGDAEAPDTGRTGDGPDGDDEVHTVIGGPPRASLAWLVVPVATSVFAFSVACVAVARRADAAAVSFAAVVLAVVGAPVLWHLGGRAYGRWGWRRAAPRPALRLTPVGLELRPAAGDDYVVRAGWGLLLTEVRNDTHGSRFWCAYSLTVEGPGGLPGFLPVEERSGPGRAPALARRRVEQLHLDRGAAVHLELLTNLLAYGTLIVLPLDGADPDELRAADEAVRRWTFGRCGLLPGGTPT